MNFAFSFRQLFLMGALLCLCLLASAYLLEHWEALHPCRLCLLQRYTLWVLTILFLAGTIGSPGRRRRLWLSSLLFIGSALGILLAGRQVWLQSLPPEQIPPCTAGFERLLAFHSLPETLKIILSSSGECGVVDYRIFGFSLAVWSLGVFILLIFYSGILLYLDKNKK